MLKRSALVWLTALAVAGCDDGNLGTTLRGDTFRAGDDGPADIPFPVGPGETFHYFFGQTFLPNHADNFGGFTVNERQTSGHVCLRVTEVDDAFLDNMESTITADVKITGQGGGQLDVVGRDGNAELIPNGTPVEYDALAAESDAGNSGLWIQALTATAVDNAFATPAPVTFDTWTPFPPPDQSIAHLLFFDGRESPDGFWKGWTDPIGVPDTTNFLSQVHRYFIDTYGFSEFFTDRTRFRWSANEAVTSCEQYSSSGDCQGAGCFWELAATSFCRPPNLTLEMVWRETLAVGEAPPELEGPVVRSLRIEYSFDGIVQSADEYLIKDVGPPAACALLVVDTECNDNGCDWDGAVCQPRSLELFQQCAPQFPYNYVTGPCASGQFRSSSQAFDDSPCSFPIDTP